MRFPLGTLLVNISGCFIVGFFLTLISERLIVHPNWRLAIAVGFVGAYTTFSALEYYSFNLLEQGQVVNGVLNVIVSLLFGFLAVWAGIACARAIWH